MTSPRRPATAVVVLAAGEGTRMRSPSRPKVLFDFAGRSMLGHVLAAVADLQPEHTAVVVGHRRDQVVEHLKQITPEAIPVVQDEQRGTGHAVRIALDALPEIRGTVVVVPGDAPLLTAGTLTRLVAHATGAAATMLTSVLADPTGYGRVLRVEDGSVRRVVEQKDACPEELAVHEVATGVYAFDAATLREAVGRLTTDNAQGEEYLPDVVGIMVGDDRPVRALTAPADETAGVNDRVQLAAAHRTYNERLLTQHMRAGVTVVDPATTWVDATVELQPDATVLPGVYLHGDTVVGSRAVVGPDVTLVDTTVGPGARISRTVAYQAEVGASCEVGPFAYLRPGTVLADEVKIGAYVEVKGSQIGAGSKVPHLSYIGDTTIGEHTNIGAASVTVNYDGVAKHRTTIGSHARTGSDTMFVAPVTVGDGAYTAAGSVITEDVPPGAMAVARARQRNIRGWVTRRRPGTASAKAAEKADIKESER